MEVAVEQLHRVFLGAAQESRTLLHQDGDEIGEDIVTLEGEIIGLRIVKGTVLKDEIAVLRVAVVYEIRGGRVRADVEQGVGIGRLVATDPVGAPDLERHIPFGQGVEVADDVGRESLVFRADEDLGGTPGTRAEQAGNFPAVGFPV